MGAATTALVGMGVSALSSSVGAGVSARRAGRRARNARLALENFENNRQDVINPYAGVEDVSDMATNLSDRITNPFADLAVATQAAEMQAEEADIALANTLDTLRATGASAGGATALAQAALRSKKNIAANIEQQEAQNQKLRAEGERMRQQAVLNEERRIQGIEISEAQRVQQAEAQDNAKISRMYGEMRSAQLQQEQSRSDLFGNISGAFGNIAQFAGTDVGADFFDGL
mgnify:CR=1 FL=1